ncbi:hypothetical protein [Burkholderia metallica]|uniref:hypothetical protein n=1 Tax=Burkholderia metallica TaxID=488729 RepID=UPI0020C68621|nr:hypothetical protein [Burkholderia metallica]
MAKVKETRIVAAALRGVDAVPSRPARHGDTACDRTIRFNPMEVARPDGGTHGMLLWLGCVDPFVHTAHG